MTQPDGLGDTHLSLTLAPALSGLFFLPGFLWDGSLGHPLRAISKLRDTHFA
jgi:hypothetical protein